MKKIILSLEVHNMGHVTVILPNFISKERKTFKENYSFKEIFKKEIFFYGN